MARRMLAAVAVLSILAGGCHASVPREPQPARSAGHFRASVWNVAESSFVRRPEAFRRILQVANADIYSFDEVGEHTSPQELVAALRGLRGAADTIWYLSWGAGGDYQRTVIASRSPLEQVPEFSPLPFPGSVDRVLAIAPDSLHARLRSDFARGVATNAVVVQAGGRRLLLIGLDLWARGDSPDSWEEGRRRLEATTIRDGARVVLERLESQGRHVDGVVIGGDMNIVAGHAPLDTLRALATGRFSRLAIAPAVHADGWSTWTWDGRGGPFHSARMDVVLFSEQTLTASSARVVDWDRLPPAERASLGLTRGPAAGLSRHRPVVVDFEWR